MLTGLSAKIGAEMLEKQCQIAEMKARLGKSAGKAELDSCTAEATPIVSMPINLLSTWQGMTANETTSGGHFNAWIRMRQKYLIERDHESNDVTKSEQLRLLISDIKKILKHYNNQLAPMIRKLRDRRQEFNELEIAVSKTC